MIIKDKAVLGCSLYTQRSKQSRLDVWPFALAYASLWLAAVAGEGVSSGKVSISVDHIVSGRSCT
jgi:hypothetical protein